MSPKFARFILLDVLGWKYTEGEDCVVPEEKAVILAAPHTSFIDFIIGFLYYESIGGHLRTMIKKEMFRFPLKTVLKWMGAFPIDRNHPEKMLMEVVHIMQQEGTFHLVICPEGTRKAVHRWKTGYHTIAKATGAPVYLSHWDYKTKLVGRGQKFELSDDAREDTRKIQEIYENMHLTAKDPKGYVTR